MNRRVLIEEVRSRARRWRRERGNRRRAQALMQLVERELPAEYEVTGDADAWPLIGAALLSRMTGTMRHIVRVQSLGRGTDPATLGRSLYEHAIHLAWLAADASPARIEEWRKHDPRSRLAADKDARESGVALMTNAQRAALRAQVDAMTGNRLVLEQLADAASHHWDGKLPGMGPPSHQNSFAGLYVVLTATTAARHTRATAGSTTSSRT